MLYSPGGDVSLCKAPHSLLQPAQCRYRPVLSRIPESTEHLLRSSQPGGGRAADLGDRSDRSPVCVHPRAERQHPLSSLCLWWSALSALHPAGCSRSTAGHSPTVEYHLLALQAPSTRYSCMRQGNCVNPPAANEPACILYCKLDLIGLPGAASFKA